MDRFPYRRRRRPEERVRVLGGMMDLVKSAEVFHFVNARLAAGEKTVVANHNLHSLRLIRTDGELRDFYRKADLIEVDSIPLIFWARLVGRASRRFHRCTYLDWRDEFWANAVEKGWRVFFLGGAEGVGERAAAAIRSEWPGAQLAIHHGYFDVDPQSEGNHDVVRAINDYRPDILLVGMGMPRQELWISRNRDRLPICAMFTVGGAFDYEAGVQTASPRWIGQIGMEWMFRLFLDPGRLFGRYCIEPWGLVGPAMRDLSNLLRRAWKSRALQTAAPKTPILLDRGGSTEQQRKTFGPDR